MAVTYPWKWLRGQKLTVKIDNAATALGMTFSPVKLSSNLVAVPTQGCELLGVAIPSAAASEASVPVIVSNDVYEVQVKSGTNLGLGDPVQLEADGSVDTLVATNTCVGCVVDYNPAASGVAHILANCAALAGAGVNDAATKMPLAGGTFTGDVTMTDGEHIVLGTTSGSKIGTAAAQKLGFWGATAVVQPSGAAQAEVTATSTNGVIAGLTSSAQTTQAEFNALRDECEKASDDARAAVALANALRLALVNAGIIKGSA